MVWKPAVKMWQYVMNTKCFQNSEPIIKSDGMCMKIAKNLDEFSALRQSKGDKEF